ncbi:SCO2521 family protein [Frankia sp. Cr1]|uniref:SCO2521 family protein n=1 Tax=Frankia sp. Cr1 TaxID=3073931 RepID=UPI002AD24C86|nr:SCO2521 family protein [Frankia sp. Cr1]
MLVLGEVRTCLLHNTAPLPTPLVAQILGTVPGRRVLCTERPIAHAVSPELVTGIDCTLATSSRVRARGIGTVTSRAMITSGLVLQGSASAYLRRATGPSRLAWSHYADQLGVVEVISRADAAELAEGYLADSTPSSTIDLGSVSERLISDIQGHVQLDHVTSVRARPTWVRWAARVGDHDGPVARVRSDGDVVHAIELIVDESQLGLAARFCEDFALHDWLLTTLGQVIEQTDRLKALGQQAIDILTTAVERLFHVWMPGAQVDPALSPLWDALEQRPGFSRQWNTQVARIRDQIALQTLQAVEQTRRGNADW